MQNIWQKLTSTGSLVGILLVSLVVSIAVYLNVQRPTRLDLPGVVETQEVRLGSKVGGRVAEVLVEEGETVEPGRLLVRYEAPELEAELRQQQAKLAAAEADLEKAKNGPRPEEIREARSDLESTRPI